jgi:putative N6-adenine-specific DNA methylase
MQMTFVALCAVGAEKVVSNELRKLNMTVLESGFGKLRFQTDIAGAYRALMSLRAADRVLLETACFQADNFDALFEGTLSVPWENFIPKGMGLHVVKVRVNRSVLKSEVSIQAVVHKAAAERLCEKYRVARLPEDQNAEVRVYVEKDIASVLLDLSGESLFKRGYRSEGGIAPLRETTAAAIILLAAWKRKFPLYDPFCGSGTIAIEAALYAWDAAPGLARDFAVSRMAFADPALEKSVRADLLAKVDFNRVIRIHGSDADPRSISAAKANAFRAYEIAQGKKPLAGERPGAFPAFLPTFRLVGMEDAAAPDSEAGFIITNPPYGKRLGEKSDSEALYQKMAGLPARFPGWKLGVITDHAGFESFYGKKAAACKEITNGAMASYFFQYERG